MRTIVLICYFVLGTIIFQTGGFLHSQNELNVTLGAGIPEALNLGVRYQMNQTQIGVSYGTFGADTFSLTGDLYFHFGGASKLTARRPWYGRLGVTYLREETSVVIDKYVYLGTRIGREFNISQRIGLNIDIGAIFQLSYKEIRKEPEPNSWFAIDFGEPATVLPALGVTFFYRFPLN